MISVYLLVSVFLMTLIIICSGDQLVSTIIDESESIQEEMTQLRLPMIGFGTAGLRQLTHEVVWRAMIYGVRMIDTAQATEWYDEQGVGTAVSEFQERFQHRIYIVTKVHPRSFSLEKMDQKLLESKNNLFRTDLDAVLLHSFKCWAGHCTKEEEMIPWQEGWKNLETLQEKHNIKAIGVSNFDLQLLYELRNISSKRISIIQNWMDPFHQDRAVREYAKEHNIQYMAYSSFGTQWSGSKKVAKAAVGISGYGENGIFTTPNPVFGSITLQRIAIKHQVRVTHVVLAWLQSENVIAIPRTSNLEHIEENFRHIENANMTVSFIDFIGKKKLTTAALPTLDQQDLQQIKDLDGTLGNHPWED